MSEHFIAPAGSPAHVIRSFCRYSGARLEDLTGKSKTWAITRLRHELMYLLRQMTVLSQSDIGRHLGGRDMATVHEGIGKVADRIAADPAYRDHMRGLKDQIIRSAAGPAALEDSGSPARIALAILQSADLSDAEARHAALQVLGAPALVEVAHG